jgi:methyl coenzyme M reductase subunit C-like uncharacterized protein (methanogenesis marker protein 7)
LKYKTKSIKIKKKNDEKRAITPRWVVKFTVVSFQNCVRQRRPVSKMAAITEIEISSNGQNCSILSQKVPKFELYKHNDELFNICYGIFYEL